MANSSAYGSNSIHAISRYSCARKRSISESNDFQQVKHFRLNVRWHNQTSNTIAQNSLDRLLEEIQLLAIDLNRRRDYPPQACKPVLEHTNKYFEAPAATNLFVGREALLEKVSTAFAASPPEPGYHLVHEPWTPNFPITKNGHPSAFTSVRARARKTSYYQSSSTTAFRHLRTQWVWENRVLCQVL